MYAAVGMRYLLHMFSLPRRRAGADQRNMCTLQAFMEPMQMVYRKILRLFHNTPRDFTPAMVAASKHRCRDRRHLRQKLLPSCTMPQLRHFLLMTLLERNSWG